jgi:hypothetical protein
MPNYDLGLLITLNIGLTLTGILAAMIGVWTILRQANANTTYLAEIVERTSRSNERVAEIAERIDARLRRQFPDIDNDLH